MEKAHARKQYAYASNSNLVLTLADRGSRDVGPSSEVTTLGTQTVRELMVKMGDKVIRTRPGEDDSLGKKKDKKRQALEEESPRPRRRRGELENVVSADIEAVYKPQTRESQAAYENLLVMVGQDFGDQPADVIRSAAEEILTILKNDKLKDRERAKEIEQLTRRPMDQDRMTRFLAISKKITDFNLDAEGSSSAGPAEDIEEVGVPVVFKEDDEDAESDLDAKEDEDEDEEEEPTSVLDEEKSRYAIGAGDSSMLDVEEDKDALDPREIDAFWVQRQLGQYYTDALQSQKLGNDVMELLQSEEPDGQIENKLVLLLDFDKFPFIKKLIKNRWKIVYMRRLTSANDEAERKTIEAEMATHPKGKAVLDALYKAIRASDRTLEIQKKLAAEAGGLRKAGLSEPVAGRAVEAKGDMFWTKRPKSMLDLDSLSFHDGARLMSNKECKLPPKSEIVNKKGYQEVFIPAPKPKDWDPREKEIKISEMPEWARPAFPSPMRALNRVQSQVYDCAFKSANNMLVCAPTGAGKTNIALLTIMRELGVYRREDGTINTDAFKIVYVAPMKALVQEMVANFSKRLEPFGVKVAELSGDQQLNKKQISETQVIVTTPEKWDIVTRKSGDRTYTQLVRLLIIDEIHLLHDSRGPVLETIVARTIRQIESTQQLVRLVGLSATLPNYDDVALFLRVRTEGDAKGLFVFDSSYRPVPLQQQYIGLTAKKAFKRHELMNEICYEKVLVEVSKPTPNQVIIFVHSRKETANTAKALLELARDRDDLQKFLRDDSGRREMLKGEAENCKHAALKELLPSGFAIHHAGMTRDDRNLVEDLFADRHISVLVSTATLAWGVNLPAHTVIIKGTQIYNPEKGRWVELSSMDVMQMMGRAGRPQYDREGEGIIITSHKELQFYLSLLNEQLPVESQFISRLADNLNAEIVLGTVTNVAEAVTWLGYTYLYIRMQRKPILYGISIDEYESDPKLEQRRIDLIHTAAALLDKHNLIKYDRKTGAFQVTDLGRVASNYYITYQSMAAFNEYLKPTMSDIELFRVFSLSSEFKYMSVREEEKLELAKLLDKVPIPIKEGMDEPSAKVNVLLQAYISRLTLEGFALMADMVFITQSAGRLMRALFEIVLKRGWAAVALRCLNLCKCIAWRTWGAQSPLRQFTGIPQDIIKRLEGKDFPWERLLDLEPHAIGELIRFPKLGKLVHKAVHMLPHLDLKGHMQPITRSVLRLELSITPDFQWDEKVHGDAEPFWVLVEDVDGETILHHEYFVLKKKFSGEETTLNFTIPIQDPLPPQYFVRVVSDRWLGAETVLPVSFRHLILPEKFAPPTELLDLQPISVTEVANERYIRFFQTTPHTGEPGGFSTFNPIQTQVFNAVYKREDNVLVCAPTGSGKTAIAELAIMKMLSQNPHGTCVYVAPSEALVQERLQDWRLRMGKILGLRVARLTNEGTADLKILQENQIIISTPQAWDVMSRRWQTRPAVQDVKLFIVDELHLIGGEVGPIIEVIVSRMRFMATQTEKKVRILGLATAVANGKDLGEWLGATGHNCFAFHPNVRPVPLEIRIQGFDIQNFNARQLAMIKPTYQAITHSSIGDKPSIVFVPSRTQARNVAVDLMAMVSAEEDQYRFLHASLEDIKPHLQHISNATLRDTLSQGIGFYHAGLSDKEKAVVERLYKAGAIQVVVAEYSLCWGMTMSAHLVVIMGTQYFDSREHRYVDCPITDVIQMMGRASRPLQDTVGKCVILCQGSKKEFYKKFLYEPFPVESHLDHFLSDHLNAEIITKRVENVQDAVDYLTWSFYYRRITQNPNYYNLQGTSHRHISDALSNLVEETIDELTEAKCVALEDEQDLSPLNLGMIASYYYLRCSTVEIFAKSLTAQTKLKGLLDVLCNASEFEAITVRNREEMALRRLAMHLPLKVPDAGEYTSAPAKVHVLLQAHFSRVPLVAAVAQDQEKVTVDSVRLLQAAVDVISSSGWLTPALAAMELSQMVTQGLWKTDSTLLQLPHITPEIAKRLEAKGIETVPDLMDMEDDERTSLLGLPPVKLADIARVCNDFPDIEVKTTLNAKGIESGDKVTLTVELEREGDEDKVGVPVVYAPRYPQVKTEGWWLVLGNPAKNELVAIKRVVMKKNTLRQNIDFIAPEAGDYKYMLFLMSDSYLGCDQEFPVQLKVAEGTKAAESSEEEEEDEEMPAAK